MNVRDLVKELLDYNPSAEVKMVVNYTPHEFDLCFGYSDGCEKNNCEEVMLMIKTDKQEKL